MPCLVLNWAGADWCFAGPLQAVQMYTYRAVMQQLANHSSDMLRVRAGACERVWEVFRGKLS